MLLNGGRSYATKIVHVYQVSLGNKHEAVEARNKIYGGSWRENVEESCCLLFDYYGIKTKVPHLYPTYVIFSSSKKNLGTFCFESQCFVDWKPRKERVALLIARNSASEVILFCASSLSRNQSSDKLITFSASRDSILDSILDYCASILGTRCMRVSRIEDRDSKETVNLHLSGTVHVYNLLKFARTVQFLKNTINFSTLRK